MFFRTIYFLIFISFMKKVKHSFCFCFNMFFLLQIFNLTNTNSLILFDHRRKLEKICIKSSADSFWVEKRIKYYHRTKMEKWKNKKIKTDCLSLLTITVQFSGSIDQFNPLHDHMLFVIQIWGKDQRLRLWIRFSFESPPEFLIKKFKGISDIYYIRHSCDF